MANNEQKEILLSIHHLKQYFPLKKGQVVKANDGVSLEIYKGETFGLVGESGCGKSTLGRTILQLYPQTYGRTMYYGRSLEELAPKYYLTTVQNLPRLKQKWQELEKKKDELEEVYRGLNEKEQFARYEELDTARKLAEDAMLNLTKIVGGFIILEDLSPIQTIFGQVYTCFKKIADLGREVQDVGVDLADAEFLLHQGRGKQEKVDACKGRLEKACQQREAAKQQLTLLKEQVEEMRRSYRENQQFCFYEQYRDEGIDLARLTHNEMRTLRADLQLIFQDPYSSLNPRMSVGQIISEGMQAHHMIKRKDERMQKMVLKLMEQCGLAPYFLHRFPHQFSGGQRQRIGIARALATNPKFVVCDEAVSALDVSIQAQIINLLQDLRKEADLTYLFITHDLSVVKYISDRIGVMYLGNLVELATSKEIFAHPMHPYTQALLNAIPTTEEESRKELQILEGDIPSPVNPPKGCKFHTRCAHCTEICEQVVPDWEEVVPGHFVACHHKLVYEHGERK